MNINTPYRTITREQFLFNEMRIVASLLSEGKSEKEIVEEIANNNLFQYPTERMIKNIAQVCLNRFKEADSKELVELVAKGSSDTAKQACLFLMMNYYPLVWEFMINVIGEKYRTKKSLVEAGYLDNARSQELNHILLDPELKDIIEHTQNPKALIAFGCM